MNKEKLSNNDKLNIIKLFNNTNLTLVNIANIYNRKSPDFIYKIFKDNNMDMKRKSIKNKLSIEDENKIYELYLNGYIVKDISKKFNLSISKINKLLSKNNDIKRRNDKTKYKINSEYFSNIDNQNKAYILGFIFADGFISKDNRVLSITVHNKDIDILEKIKSELETTTKIRNIKTKDHSRINICNTNICKDLNTLGCFNGKTFYLDFPDLNEDLIFHFIRGFMDGDGSIGIINMGIHKYFNLRFSGTESMINSLKKYFGVDSRIIFHNNSYALQVDRRRDALRILRHIYLDANLYLNRKYDKYIEIEKYIEEVGEEHV